ncbi:MAG: hypothetical protein ACREVL_14850, partial [Solimonas sp.]
MTTQDRRIRELQDRHTPLQGKMLAEEVPLAAKAIAAYFPAKIDHLKGLLAIIGGSEEKRAQAFTDRIAEATRTLDSTLGATYRDVREPSLTALVFETQAHTEERRYFESLAKLDLGAMRDELFGKIAALKTFTEGLQRKWDETKVNNDSLLHAEKEATDEITRIVDEGVTSAKAITVGIQGLPGKIGDRYEQIRKTGEQAIANLWKKLPGDDKHSEVVGKTAVQLAVEGIKNVLAGMVAGQAGVELDALTDQELEKVQKYAEE